MSINLTASNNLCLYIFSKKLYSLPMKRNSSDFGGKLIIDFQTFFSNYKEHLFLSKESIINRLKTISANMENTDVHLSINKIYGGYNVKIPSKNLEYFIIGNYILESIPRIAPYHIGKKAYLFSSQGKIEKVISISEFYLNNLPSEAIQIFRGLSRNELLLWKMGDIENLIVKGSDHSNFGFAEPVLHFSLSTIAGGWSHKEQINIILSKRLLKKLIDKQYLYIGLHPTLIEFVFKKNTWRLLMSYYHKTEINEVNTNF